MLVASTGPSALRDANHEGIRPQAENEAIYIPGFWRKPCPARSMSGNLENGGADGVRTHDLLDAIEARSQLRHGPTGGWLILTQRTAAGDAIRQSQKVNDIAGTCKGKTR
jgi:hypothetical protein